MKQSGMVLKYVAAARDEGLGVVGCVGAPAAVLLLRRIVSGQHRYSLYSIPHFKNRGLIVLQQSRIAGTDVLRAKNPSPCARCSYIG